MGLVIPESVYFKIEEFAVSGAHPHLVEPVPDIFRKSIERLVRGVLHPLRVAYGKSMRVLSGYRNDLLNEAVGGSPTSQHRFGQAADIGCADPGELYRLAWEMRAELDCGQIIYYPLRGFVHFATKSSRYPKPTFFVSRTGKSYQLVDTQAEMEAAIS